MTLPARSSATNYDANNKQNDLNNPPAVQSLQWDNTKLAQAIADMAECGYVAPRFWCNFTTSATTPVLVNWFANWSIATPIAPILSRTSTGIYVITAPTQVQNEYQQSLGNTVYIPVAFSGAHGNICSTSTIANVQCVASANVITVATSASGALSDLSTTQIFVVGY